MKKKEYKQPKVLIVTSQTEPLLSLSKPETTDNTNGGAAGPSYGGDGEATELSKKHNFNAWTTWDD